METDFLKDAIEWDQFGISLRGLSFHLGPLLAFSLYRSLSADKLLDCQCVPVTWQRNHSSPSGISLPVDWEL